MPRTSAVATKKPLKSIAWEGGLESGRLVLLDQTRLPSPVRYVALKDLEGVRQAICDTVVRGSSAIGIAAAYGLVLHLIPRASAAAGKNSAVLAKHVDAAIARLVSACPSAVNARWAMTRQRACFKRHLGHLTALEMCARLLMEAKRIHREDEEFCGRIAEHTAPLLAGGVLTFGNTGALATGGAGTALGGIIRASELGRKLRVFVCETRPLLQGARMTVPELMRAKVPTTLVPDVAAAALMVTGQVKMVIIGADCIAANGDIANRLGSYQLAVLARGHRIPFYVAAPSSSFDAAAKDGTRIGIEQRSADEVRKVRGMLVAPADVPVWNPAVDIVPAELITALITDRGVVKNPTAKKLRAALG